MTDEKPKDSFLKSLIQVVGGAILIATAFRFLVGFTVQINGISMEPTFYHNEMVFSATYPVKLGNIKRGDIVIVKRTSEHEDVIKRILAIPGDTLEFSNDRVILNGKTLNEPYINKAESAFYPAMTYVLKENEYFILGDNRGHSTDSRMYGPINKDTIRGVVKFRYYPFDRIGIIK
ncbi:MAG: signal peptidase I [Tissierellia bacterium]|nr:signal peptidase I [Tissierellia bacterium]